MKKQSNDNNSSRKGKSSSNINSNRTRNNQRSLYGCNSLPFILLLCCLVFFFHARLGLALENEGNLTVDNSSIPCPSVFKDKLHDDAYSHDANKSSNNTNGVLLEVNLSANCNNSAVHIDIENRKQSPTGANRQEHVIWSVLGYRALVCEAQNPETWKTGKPKEPPTGRPHHSTYLNFDEFRNITSQETGQGTLKQLVNITHRLEYDGKEYNYASAMKGAKVVAYNKEAKGACNILGKDHDKYLRNPCSVGKKFVVIELSEETLVDVVQIANFEYYSSNFKDFELSGSLNYPTETWTPLGNFTAANVKHIQNFKLPEPKWVRYLKLNLFSQYGSEFYCTLSVVEVYGVDAIERMLEDLFVSSKESSPNKLPKPNLTVTPLLKPELGHGRVHNEADNACVETENTDDSQQLNVNLVKNPMIIRGIPDPVTEVRQQPISRIPGDTVLKILMQKVRSLELNLSVLEEYIKELNRRQGDMLPELDKELSRISLLLEKSKTEIKDLTEWKENRDTGLTDLSSWKAVVSSRMDALVRENTILRLEIEKIVNEQANLERKEFAVLIVSLLFACFATIKLVSARFLTFLGAPPSDKVCWASKGWVMILVSSTMTIFITLLSS